jgi:hypothetical protein
MNIHSKPTYESMTSFFARTRKRGPSLDEANSRPTARGFEPAVSKIIRVTLVFTAIVKFGRARTVRVRYADSVVTRRPWESMYVTTEC